MRFSKAFCGSFVLGAVALSNISTTAVAGIFGSQYPDVIVCNSATSGPRSFYIMGNFANLGNLLVYRIPPRTGTADASQVLYNSDATGSYNSEDDMLADSDCLNVSLADIAARGDAYDFVDPASGGNVPSGALLQFNLANCPSGWTRQVQVNAAGSNDNDVLLCRKD